MADPTPSGPVPCAAQRCQRAGRSGDLRRRPAAPGFRLCGSCRRTLAADLAALPELHRDSEEQSVLPARNAAAVRVTGHLPAAPAGEVGVEVRHDAAVRLVFWSRLVLDEQTSEPAPPGRAVPELAEFLARHVDFLAAHPAAGPAADEIADVAGALRRLVAPPRAPLVPLGRCVEPGCGAEVLLPGRGGDDLVLRGPKCRAGHVLTPRQWLLLKRGSPTTGTEESS
ncbi:MULTISPECIES: hypothetical protein [Streptomyces]|uniref:hypothetical protein n=1 Tax=Streptomyces TaxID=1883 RepID=UPI000CD4CE38|nr:MULTISPECIES: hypothetical protein [Streptomyces]